MTTPRRRRQRVALLFTAWVLSIAAATASAILAQQGATASARRSLEALAVAGAQTNREASLAGCERTKADRIDAIRGWSRAARAWRAVARSSASTPAERANGAATAAVYQLVISGYRSRIVNCGQAFPPINVEAIRRTVREATGD